MNNELNADLSEHDAVRAAPLSLVPSSESEIKNLIRIVRGQQVIIDADLAMLYEVETGSLNRAAARNLQRFPEDFRFQLTKEEFVVLKCQIGISKSVDARGGRQKRPYAYTEQGIAMLSGLLRSEVAVNASINIMRAFVQMRRFLADNAGLLQRMDVMEARQLEYQRHTDERFGKVFECLEAQGVEESPQKIFFDGQIYDAFELLVKLVRKAQKEIILIDGYINLDTLNVLAKKRKGVNVVLCTTKRGNTLSEADRDKFNAQYPKLDLKITEAFHDRFLIADKTLGYHIGASIKDAGKKCFGISRIVDEEIVCNILERLSSCD